MITLELGKFMTGGEARLNHKLVMNNAGLWRGKYRNNIMYIIRTLLEKEIELTT